MFPSRRRRRRPRGEIDPAVMATWTDKQRKQEEMHQALELSLAEAGLPVRVVNTMENNGVLQVKDLLEEDGKDLVEMRNLGEKTVREIIKCIHKLGLETPASWAEALRKKKPTQPTRKK